MKKLPKTVYIRWAELEGDAPYLDAQEIQSDHAEMGATRLVGRYELKETKRVTGIAEVKA